MEKLNCMIEVDIWLNLKGMFLCSFSSLLVDCNWNKTLAKFYIFNGKIWQFMNKHLKTCGWNEKFLWKIQTYYKRYINTKASSATLSKTNSTEFNNTIVQIGKTSKDVIAIFSIKIK